MRRRGSALAEGVLCSSVRRARMSGVVMLMPADSNASGDIRSTENIEEPTRP